MAKDRIRLACRDYDRTSAIVRGRLTLDDVDLDVVEHLAVPAMFAAVFRGDYDVAEWSMAELCYYTSRNRSDFVGIPVFPSRIFRHGYIFVNADAGIATPDRLDGKRIGFDRLVQTAAVWIHGLMVEEFGVSPKGTGWLVAATHHWDDGAEHDRQETRDGTVVHQLPPDGRPANETMERALLEGTIDALGTPQIPTAFRRGDRRIRRLFERYPDVEAAYYARTKIFPIMHVLVIRKTVAAAHPELPRQLFTLFSRARRLGRTWARMDPSLSIVWKNAYLDEEERIFQGDPWTYGLAANAPTVEKFLGYCHALGVTERRLSARDLFVPSTWELTEEGIGAGGP